MRWQQRGATPKTDGGRFGDGEQIASQQQAENHKVRCKFAIID